MAKYTLTNQGYMGLGIYIGFKSFARREEMAYYGVNYDEVVTELTRVGLIRNGRIDRKEAKLAWSERFGLQLGSQVHQYKRSLGYN